MLPLQGFPVLDRYTESSFDAPPFTPERRSKDAACRSHKEAERRRRQRINTHLSTLRSLLPNNVKSTPYSILFQNDKASLLAEAVRVLRELRRQAVNHAPLPGEDESTVTWVDGEAKVVRATVCCDDRPGLSGDLTRAIRTVRGRAVRAEMATAGGRTRMVVLVQTDGGGTERVEALRRALKDVAENRVSGIKRGWVYVSGWEDDHRLLVG